jgi:hypothetical protein
MNVSFSVRNRRYGVPRTNAADRTRQGYEENRSAARGSGKRAGVRRLLYQHLPGRDRTMQQERVCVAKRRGWKLAPSLRHQRATKIGERAGLEFHSGGDSP